MSGVQDALRSWEFEEESLSDGVAWSVYDQYGDRITAPYIGRAHAMLVASAPKMLKELKAIRHQVQVTTEHFNRLQRLIENIEQA